MVKSVMDAEPTAEEVEQFQAIDTENRLVEEENEREIAAAKGEQTQSQFDPLADCDPRDQRVRDTERDGRLRHRDYDSVVDNFVLPLIRQRPEVFRVLRDSVDAGEAAWTLGKLLQNPQLANDPKFKGFEEYLRDVAERKTGKFDNLSVTDFERALEDYKTYGGDETIEEFFNRKTER